MVERLYLAEVDLLRLVDVVIDNTVFDQPRLLPVRNAGGGPGVTMLLEWC